MEITNILTLKLKLILRKEHTEHLPETYTFPQQTEFVPWNKLL